MRFGPPATKRVECLLFTGRYKLNGRSETACFPESSKVSMLMYFSNYLGAALIGVARGLGRSWPGQYLPWKLWTHVKRPSDLETYPNFLVARNRFRLTNTMPPSPRPSDQFDGKFRRPLITIPITREIEIERSSKGILSGFYDTSCKCFIKHKISF